jgi:coenzyme F420-0:L-glutamate ligase/coenzyme F420-1:gamma-L-glutamate ligase
VSPRIEIEPLGDLPEVAEGDSVGALIAAAANRAGLALADDDGIVVSQKIVSKAEGRVRRLAAVAPGAEAAAMAAELDRDPRLVELVLNESRRVVRATSGVLIVETNSGWVCANAGIDASNMDEGLVALLPADPDASARRIRAELDAVAGVRPAVVVADSFGRPWRVGQCDVAIGCAGLVAVDDWRGRADTRGRELTATVIAVADQLAAAADLARDKTSGAPAALVRGAAPWRTDDDGPGAAATLQRAAELDLFR